MLINNSEKKKIKSAKDIAEILQKILSTESEIDQDKEHFWSIGLTAGNNIKYIELVTLGILNASLAAPREVFGLAIQKRVCNIITAHNHPSGNITMPASCWKFQCWTTSLYQKTAIGAQWKPESFN
jgi:DNA repair protein RadC